MSSCAKACFTLLGLGRRVGSFLDAHLDADSEAIASRQVLERSCPAKGLIPHLAWLV